MDYLAAIALVVFAVGFIMLLLGMPAEARYGGSTLYGIGLNLMLLAFIVAIMGVAAYGAVWLITEHPIPPLLLFGK